MLDGALFGNVVEIQNFLQGGNLKYCQSQASDRACLRQAYLLAGLEAIVAEP